MRSLLCILPCLLSIFGCSTTTPYPADWPRTAAATTSRCSDLTGSYENHGRAHDRDRFELARVFFYEQDPTESLDHYEVMAVSHVTLDDRFDDSLVVKAWVGDELLTERLLTAAQLPCHGGRRVYKVTGWYGRGVMALPFVAHSRIDFVISLALDGSMVIEEKNVEVGWAGLFPIAGSSQSWYSFLRTSPDSPGLRTDSNSPRGVRTGTYPVFRLLSPEGDPKQSFFDGYMNTKAYKDAQACLDLATNANEPFDQQTLALLGGRSTQAFVIQHGRGGTLYTQNGKFGELHASWVPGTHKLRIEKLHWQPPLVADRYVICLLQKGYRWDS